jgi:tetratricopeptide (TPR) repeat protein
LGVFQSDMAQTLIALDRLDEAEPLLISALERAERSGDLETLLRTQARQARLWARTGRLDDAATLIGPAEQRARKMFYQRGMADTSAALGDIARLRSDAPAAQKHYAEALRLYTILHDPAAQEISAYATA